MLYVISLLTWRCFDCLNYRWWTGQRTTFHWWAQESSLLWISHSFNTISVLASSTELVFPFKRRYWPSLTMTLRISGVLTEYFCHVMFNRTRIRQDLWVCSKSFMAACWPWKTSILKIVVRFGLNFAGFILLGLQNKANDFWVIWKALKYIQSFTFSKWYRSCMEMDGFKMLLDRII